MPDAAVAYQTATLVPVTSLGTDEQGRELVTCPGCREPAVVLPDATIRCGWCEAVRDRVAGLMAEALERAGDA